MCPISDTNMIMETQKRKRTAVACHYCRRRKRKCDGRQPVCTLCEEANNSECEYPATEDHKRSIPVDQTAEILSRLQRLEQSFTHFASLPPTSHPQPDDHYTPTSHTYPPPSQNPSPESAFPSPGYGPLSVDPSLHIPSAAATPVAPPTEPCITAPMAIPMSHSTTTGSLLQSRSAKALLGDYPSDVFLRVESKRTLPEPLSLTPIPLSQIVFPDIDAEEASSLMENFFDLMNPQHPILDRDDFEHIYRDVVGNPLQADLRAALVLVVLALGRAAVDTPDLTRDGWLPGVDIHRSMRQPLEETHTHQPVTRLCWAIFVLECDIIAEHHLPRSGIDQVIENLPFPRCGNPPDPTMLSWLADLSARRLLNRIHHVMYDTASPTTNSATADAFASVSAELSHQLGAWYDLLPSAIKPDLHTASGTALSVDEAIMVLRLYQP
ncbi:putative transcriptional regulatory protein [Colletotrichum sp. SAR11_57]|nr:putative transcriptional regulatory protein [Colletotrichum sp. SAR11_57]